MVTRMVSRLLFLWLLSSAASAQQGLQGEYFNALNPPPFGTPGDFRRVDPFLNFQWNGDAPNGTPIIPDDQYSERWTGFVQIDEPGVWLFTTRSNDGLRLWVDDQLVVEAWDLHGAQNDTGSVHLRAPGWYPLVLEHFNSGGTATVKLQFQGPGQSRVVIPASHLLVELDANPPLTVEAGSNKIVLAPANQRQISGTVQSLHGIQQTTWSQVGGPPATINSPNSLQSLVQLGALGVYTFRLTVLDLQGNTETDEVSLFLYDVSSPGTISGKKQKWHKLSFAFFHDATLSESGSPNPFLDFRLQVRFAHPDSGTAYDVPGFFDADGNAANTSATSGRVFRVNFTPDHAGTWLYQVSFRRGTNVAIDSNPQGGSPISFDGAGGFLGVEPSDPTSPGLRSQGMLRYVFDHHLEFAETGQRFLKGGADSPENLLGYYEFDNTHDLGGLSHDLDGAPYFDGLHHFDAHAGDFQPGGPTWLGGGATPKGQNLLGAIDYLGQQGANSIYFLTYNIDRGDGQEVWPWVAPGRKTEYDVSKISQWELVLDHMTDCGLALNVITQETENDTALSGGNLGTDRRLYYRELIARFSHNLALVWNLGEENTNSNAQQESFADYIREMDPYDHPITVHTFPADIDSTYNALLGFENFEGPSLQIDINSVNARTKQFVDDSARTGRAWFACNDEQTPASDGVVPDNADFWHDAIRKKVLWGNLMGEGGGVEYYFGYSFPHSDMDCENWRTRQNMWDLTRIALDFFQEELPFAQMHHADHLTSDGNDHVLAKLDEVYAVYRPNGGSTNLDLGGSNHTFNVRWFNPKTGVGDQLGSRTSISGPGKKSLGNPPSGGNDWVALVRRADNLKPGISQVSWDYDQQSHPGTIRAALRATDGNGRADILWARAYLWAPQGGFVGWLPLQHVGGDSFVYHARNTDPAPSGDWLLIFAVADRQGEYALQDFTWTVP